MNGQYNPPSFKDTRIDVYAYLLIGSTDVVLIDTGVGYENAYINKQFQPEHLDLEQSLAERSITPSDVTALINSHLHFDHCGNNALFEHAPVYIQQKELDAAKEPYYTVEDWFQFPCANILAVDGDFKVCPGISLLPTPGHTPGHQSVAVNAKQGVEVVGAQVAFTASEFLEGGHAEVQSHPGLEVQYAESIDDVKKLSAQSIYFSHDNAVLHV